MTIVLNQEDLLEYQTGSRRMIQTIFPYLSADEREFLMTGITPAEWNELFADSED